MDSVIDRSRDRFNHVIKTSKRNTLYPKAGLVKPWNKKGSKILLCPPTQKSFTYYGKDYTDVHYWCEDEFGKIIDTTPITYKNKYNNGKTVYIKWDNQEKLSRYLPSKINLMFDGCLLA